jgi:Mn-dependent DtxR family transcriptional regulator
VIFFYQGESLYQPQDLLETIRLIAENRRIECSRIAELLGTTPAAAELLLQLINEGVLEPVGELL